MHNVMSMLALGATPGGGGGGFIASLLPIAAMIAILWFLLIRPQQKEQQRHKQMVANLRKGDDVVTVGGLYGRIVSLNDEKVSLRVADDVKLDVERSKVVRVVSDSA